MLQQKHVLLYVLIVSIELNNALVCYFQRCQNIETIGWVCNYHDKGVEVECQPDEVCFEETHKPVIFSEDGALVMERNCRSTAIINGHLYYLKPWLDHLFPEGGENCIAEETYDGSAYSVGNLDLCNDFFHLPPSFQIAKNTKCYYDSWLDGEPGCSNPSDLGREKICGSELNWVCSALKRFFQGEGNYWHRECVDVDSLDETVRNQLQSGESPCVVIHPYPIFVSVCYCSSSLCNNNCM